MEQVAPELGSAVIPFSRGLTPEADKPTYAQCMREAGAVLLAAAIRIERERLMAEAEALP